MFITELWYIIAETKQPKHSTTRKWLSYKIVARWNIMQPLLKLFLQMKKARIKILSWKKKHNTQEYKTVYVIWSQRSIKTLTD